MILLFSNNLSLVYTMYSLVNKMTVRIKYCTNPGLSSCGKLKQNKAGKARPGFPSGRKDVGASREEGRFQSCPFSSRTANGNQSRCTLYNAKKKSILIYTKRKECLCWAKTRRTGVQQVTLVFLTLPGGLLLEQMHRGSTVWLSSEWWKTPPKPKRTHSEPSDTQNCSLTCSHHSVTCVQHMLR